jgi:hypothetical protein
VWQGRAGDRSPYADRLSVLPALIPTTHDELRRLTRRGTTIPAPRAAGIPTSAGIGQPERPMIARSNCDCLVCRLEKSLIAEFANAESSEHWLNLAAASHALARFPTCFDLIRHLHAPGDPQHSSSADAVLSTLLDPDSRFGRRSLCQQLLLLVFIPTIHRTASHITAAFPSLVRDDVSQQVVSVFLEFLHSAELQARRSHLAFTIARKLRRNAFRWAIRESRSAPPEDTETDVEASADAAACEGPLPADRQLSEFLDSCQEHGWLSVEERHLLVQFKIEGISFAELSRNGHSKIAIQHRIQRLMDRLRRLAQSSGPALAEQLELFPP